jgi:hypothetical protein
MVWLLQYWGIDAEGKAEGLQLNKNDIHSIQVCPSTSEKEAKIFWNPEDFKAWLTQRRKNCTKPKIFYAFTLAFEYGSLSAWELLNIGTARNKLPWQSWADEPVNLFYIHIGKMKIPVFDTRLFFYQLRYGNDYLTNLDAVSRYLSEYYATDIHKLPKPMGDQFGKRPPNQQEKPYFSKYAIRDAFISAKAGQWINENVIQKWLKNSVNITNLYSWGTVARHYFTLPKINEVRYYGKHGTVIQFPNLWHKQIYESTFAGRNEAYRTGTLEPQYYNDCDSLYPYALIKTQALLIKNVQTWNGSPEKLLGKINCQKFYEVTGCPYGWIIGTFKTTDDLWGLPLKIGENNVYLTGTIRNKLYHTLDLEASNAEALEISTVLTPIFDEAQKGTMQKFEELTRMKLEQKYTSEVEKFAIKNTINSTSGILGKSHPTFAEYTNIPAYNTLLAESHLTMSRLFHKFAPVTYTDTDSFFSSNPINETIELTAPYPTLPFQTLDTIPLRVGCRAQPEGNTVVFRAKMYWLNPKNLAFSGWKPFPSFFNKIVQAKTTTATIEKQLNRKFKTRDKSVAKLAVGRWLIKREEWNLEKLKQIFRADTKRQRSTYDSYTLFLNDKNAPSTSWNAQQLNELYGQTWQFNKVRPIMALAQNRHLLNSLDSDRNTA